jgi:hypothetical protein
MVMSIWRYRNLYVSFHRAEGDYLKYLILGVGACGEMAKATKSALGFLGLESRLVDFPGEDHMFVEVRINATWLVVDPGYRLNLLTREERGNLRLQELGGLSYAFAHTENGFIELTSEYTMTDSVLVRVTRHGEPLSNARVILQHKFMGSIRKLPPFHTNTNGTVTFHLGPMMYDEASIEPVGYWIYVDEIDTGHNVTSSGTGDLHCIEIDLEDND